ncbi:MAG: N-acetyl-gamma-glutamyl-phosphate reductase [Bdellovibrionota bacterium]
MNTNNTVSNPSVAVAIFGGTGYGAGELLRLLAHHPDVQVVSINSRTQAGTLVTDIHPHLLGFYEGLRFTSELDMDALKAAPHRILISALPHEVSGKTAEALEPTRALLNMKLIDLSGAHRLTTADSHAAFYPKTPRSEELTQQFTYGLTELFREEVAAATHIANPGCLATASILSLAPIANLIKPSFIAYDTKTGSSGSGRELKEGTHHPTRHSSYTAYKPLSHQHLPEVSACLDRAGLSKCETSFIAQSLPIARGIYVTTHIHNKTELPKEKIIKAFQEFDANNRFFRFRTTPPHLQPVLGTNFCDVSVAVEGKKLIVMAAIDNLVKGMAGQAIQNLNLMCGFPEERGLMIPGTRPY